MEELNLTLPFINKEKSIGRIGKITTDLNNKCYLKYEYDANGKLKKAKPVPKSRIFELKENYYLDVLAYLRFNQEKAELYRNTRLKKNINLKSLYADIVIFGLTSIVGGALTLASLKLAASMWVTVVSMLIFSSSGTYFFTKLREKQKYDEDIKKREFLSQYQNYQIELNNFQLVKKEYYFPTMYKGIAKNESNVHTLKKTRLLEKESR